MSETIDRLPVPRLYLGVFPTLLVGVVYTLAGVVALLTNTVPANNWLTPILGVFFLAISIHKLYTTSPDDDDLVADYWIVIQYFFALILLTVYASAAGLIGL